MQYAAQNWEIAAFRNSPSATTSRSRRVRGAVERSVRNGNAADLVTFRQLAVNATDEEWMNQADHIAR